MLTHIKRLSKDFNLLICCNNVLSIKKLVPKNVSLHNINFVRKPNLLIDIASFFSLLYFFLKNKPYLPISLTPTAGFLTALASFIARVSYRIHWFTGQLWVTKKGLTRIFYKILDRIIFSLSHHVLVDSNSQKKFLISKSIIKKQKSTVLLHGSVGGVNVKKFKYSKKERNLYRKKLKIRKNDFIFLYLGRINRDKGIIELIKAFKKIDKFYKAFLILVGPIEENFIKNYIKYNKKVIYAKNYPEKWFSVGDIVCLPSFREGFGLWLLRLDLVICQLWFEYIWHH